MRSVVVIVAVILALAVAFAVTRTESAPDHPTEPAVLETTPSSTGSVRTTEPTEVDVTSTRLEVEPAPGVPTLRVHVVDDAGAPIAGAEVRHTLPRAPEGWGVEANAREWDRDRAGWTARFGVVSRTNALGSLAIAVPDLSTPPAGNAMYLCALHDGAFAEDFVSWAEMAGAEITLRLATEVELTVRLVDHADRPVAGVAIEARYARSDAMIGVHDTARALGSTNHDGLVRSPHVQLWSEQVHVADGARRVVVGPEIPGFDRVGTEVSLEPLPQDPVVVRMPPTGRIAVEVAGWTEPSGTDRPRIELRAVDGAGEFTAREPSGAAIDADGRAVFPRVALDRDWKARLTPSMRFHSFAGPRAIDEEVVYRIESPLRPFLTGRLLRDGMPLAAVTFGLNATGESMAVATGGRTDDDGRFRIERYPPEIDTTISGLCCTVFTPGADDALIGRLERPCLLVRGDNELGDIAVASVPSILTGRLLGAVDRKGVRLLCEAADPNGAFHVVRNVVGEVDPNGAFRLRGEVEVAALRLVVFAPKIVPIAPIPFVAGQRDLEITLGVGGGIAIDAILGDPRAFTTIEPRLMPTDGHTADQLLAMPGASTRGIPGWDRAVPARRELASADQMAFRYVWDGLPAGRYRIEFRGAGIERAALEVPDVLVNEGEETTVTTVDLRERIHLITLRFPDLDRPGLVEHRVSEGRFSLGHVFVMGGTGPSPDCISIDAQVAFVATVDPVDLVIDVDGFRRRVLHGVREDTEVRLEAGLPVELTVNAPIETPSGAAVIVGLTPGEGAALPSGGRISSPAAGGWLAAYTPPAVQCERDGDVFRAAVPAPGTYLLTAKLRLLTGRIVPLRVSPTSIVVKDTGARCAIDVRN